MIEIAIVGKPNVGKSTLFNALTLAEAPVANYPFTTIDANIGIGYVRVKCLCREFNVKDNPKNSFCIDGNRFIPVKIIDTAGLVPDAWRGRGLGNQFLDKISKAEALIHVVDASGATDKEGRITKPGDHDPMEDIEFLEKEIIYWVRGILKKHWNRVLKQFKFKRQEVDDAIYESLSGLKFSKETIKIALNKTAEKFGDLLKWDDEALYEFTKYLVKLDKPMVIAANKIDLPYAEENIKRMRDAGYDVMPISALSEYILKKLSKNSSVKYLPGDSEFVIIDSSLDKKFLDALTIIRKKIFEKYGGTNVQQLINHVVFDILKYIVVYPVRNPIKLTDADGNVLPDALLVKEGTTLRELAYLVHSELGDKLAFGINVRNNARLRADYLVRNNDVISFVLSGK